jgi:phage terminase large subunit
MQIPFKFINKATEDFFNCTKRNSCLSGGYGSGKTYVACMKIIFLSLSYAGYRSVIARKEFKALKETTLRTFKKVCPESLYTFNPQEGVMTFKNGSTILWMHLDDANEQTLRGLEVNSVYLDQPEELEEQIYTTLNARIGRWDKAKPTDATLKVFGYKSIAEWPRDPKTGNLVIPSYMMLTPNPDSETHWIWRKYHTDSPEAQAKRAKKDDHAYFEVASTDNPMLPQENLDIMLANDPSWVARFVYGRWGISDATIHILPPQSKIRASRGWIENFLQKSALYRVLDHGETAPTCCLWWAAYKDIYVCYREYYQPGKVISYHRKQIHSLSSNENYVCDWADPAIFKMTSQKYGGHWSTADEYREEFPPEFPGDIPPEPLFFQPADNAELSTRNRINELLSVREKQLHPVTGEPHAPRLFFVEKSDQHEYGCHHAIIQMRSQRRVKLGEIEGKATFSDEREKSVEDHAYDCVRYFIAMHARQANMPTRAPSHNSFIAARKSFKLNKLTNSYGDRRSIA